MKKPKAFGDWLFECLMAAWIGLVLVITLVILLAGCAAFEGKVEYVPFEVRVPIAVPCAADPGPEPPWATRDLKKSDTLDDKEKALLAEREQRMGYEEKLKAATDGCR